MISTPQAVVGINPAASEATIPRLELHLPVVSRLSIARQMVKKLRFYMAANAIAHRSRAAFDFCLLPFDS
jgi:hypothetical protein